ncbi:hypothetical protein COL41_29035 [Bacillus mycoides]|uniref:hypothetical protein n=1 Tax=Bacillus mycoides TaxID=1405 RepID=UPI000BF4EFDE|nr:hypothetical protein [Bacillus mycoides]PFX88602.1 hypothetical protein COL41_29035 [Bacillus mycoides]
MSVSVSNELQLFAQEIQSALSPNALRDLARDVGFVQRTSKYQAFFQKYIYLYLRLINYKKINFTL